MSDDQEDPETREAKEEGVRRGGDELPDEPGSGKAPDEPSEAGKQLGGESS